MPDVHRVERAAEQGLHGSGRGRGARVRRAALADSGRGGIKASQVGARLPPLVGITDGAIAVNEAQQRRYGPARLRVVREPVLEAKARRVVGPAPEVEHPVLVGLL